MPRYANKYSGGAVAYSLRESGEHYELSDHLTLGEMACHDGTDTVLVHPDLPEAFELTRASLSEHFQEDCPLVVHSGYRTWYWNKLEGGADESVHPLGCALDVSSPLATPDEIARHAQPFFGGIGLYDNFVHLDVWRHRSW